MYLAYGLVSLEKYDADPSLCTGIVDTLCRPCLCASGDR